MLEILLSDTRLLEHASIFFSFDRFDGSANSD